jgi:hypothetical protein
MRWMWVRGEEEGRGGVGRPPVVQPGNSEGAHSCAPHGRVWRWPIAMRDDEQLKKCGSENVGRVSQDRNTQTLKNQDRIPGHS